MRLGGPLEPLIMFMRGPPGPMFIPGDPMGIMFIMCGGPPGGPSMGPPGPFLSGLEYRCRKSRLGGALGLLSYCGPGRVGKYCMVLGAEALTVAKVGLVEVSQLLGTNMRLSGPIMLGLGGNPGLIMWPPGPGGPGGPPGPMGPMPMS